MDDKEIKFQKDIAIAQIGATAVATLGSIIIAIGISMIVLSTSLSFEGIVEDEAKFQFFQIISANYLNQGILMVLGGLGIFLTSLAVIVAKIRKMKP